MDTIQSLLQVYPKLRSLTLTRNSASQALHYLKAPSLPPRSSGEKLSTSGYSRSVLWPDSRYKKGKDPARQVLYG
jgi:hypothetical protein